MQKILQLYRTLRRIRRSNLEDQFKQRIKATAINTFGLGRYDSKEKIADIAGFKVRYLEHRTLTYLFDEIFLSHDYHFTSEKTNPSVIDCGSNIGMSVLYTKMLYPDARVVAFEPGERAYACLQENVQNNGLRFVETHNAAVSDRAGSIDFYYDDDKVGSLKMSTKHDRMSKQVRSVKAELLSEYIDGEVDFLKMDIEGAEVEVVEEIAKAGKIGSVGQMIIEYHHHIAKEVDSFSRLLALLEQAGFGYQIQSDLGRPLVGKQFQDILVYAYQKKPAAQ